VVIALQFLSPAPLGDPPHVVRGLQSPPPAHHSPHPPTRPPPIPFTRPPSTHPPTHPPTIPPTRPPAPHHPPGNIQEVVCGAASGSSSSASGASLSAAAIGASAAIFPIAAGASSSSASGARVLSARTLAHNSRTRWFSGGLRPTRQGNALFNVPLADREEMYGQVNALFNVPLADAEEVQPPDIAAVGSPLHHWQMMKRSRAAPLADDEVQPLPDVFSTLAGPLADPLADAFSPLADDEVQAPFPSDDEVQRPDIAVGSPLHTSATHTTQAKHWAKHGTGYALGQTK
jgi:hypothetical protein